MSRDIVSVACDVAQKYPAEARWLPDLRKSLKSVISRQEAKAIGLQPDAGPYLATLRVLAAIDLPQAMVALRTQPEDTAEELMRIVYDRCHPNSSGAVRADAFKITAAWFVTFQAAEKDGYQLMRPTWAFFRRVISGLPEAPDDVIKEMKIHINLMTAMTYEIGMANDMRDVWQ